MEYPVFDIVVHCLFRDPQFWVGLQYLVRRKPLFEERFNNGSHIFGLRYGKVHALSGVNKCLPVVVLGIFGGIGVLVEAAVAPAGTAVAGARSAVPSGTAEGDEIRTVRSTLAPMDTLAVRVAFQREAAFVRKGSVEFDFFTDSGLVLADSLGNGGLRGAVDDASEDDAAFLQGKVGKGIIITHVKYLPFRQLSGIISVRLNATFMEVEICERLKSTFPPSKWK